MVLENTISLANALFEFTRGEEDKDIFMEKVLKVFKVYKVKCLETVNNFFPRICERQRKN